MRKVGVILELYFLGTGAGMPTRQRNVTSIALNLLAENGNYWLFDCGEGTQHQILRSPLKMCRMNKLFITHLHGDHIYGIPGLLTSRSYQGGVTPFTIYGPQGIRAYIEQALFVSQAHLGYALETIEIEEGVVYTDAKFKIETRWLEHRIPSLGYRITERDQPGKLDIARLQVLGVRPGPMLGEIKLGKTVTLEDGTVLDGKNYVGSDIPGRIIAIFGDTRKCDNERLLAHKADVVVHEATFFNEHKELAAQYYHTTSAEAAKLASREQVGMLLLTHISSRYQEEKSMRLLEEAQQIFEHTYLAEDHKNFPIVKAAVAH